MMAPEPLKSAMTIGNAEDTSLALPSDATLRTGQARVLNQVHTIKRSKSKHGKNAPTSPSSPSPTSLTSLGLSEVGTFKFTPFKPNGMFKRSNSAMTTFNKSVHSQKSRTLSTKSMGGRIISSSGTIEQPISPPYWSQNLTNGLKPSRSDPALTQPLSIAPQSNGMRAKGQTASQQTRVSRHSMYSLTNGGQMTTSQTRMGRPPSAQSNNESKTIKTTKTEQKTIVTNGLNTSEMTLSEAVAFLSHPEENYQQCGASFIQHSTFKEDLAKQEVSQLGGIPPLVGLLRSDNPGVCQAAAGALRNLVFKNEANKLETQNCGGIGKALQLLKETNSTETQKQITGLLWNLSSSDELKSELIATALPVLTEHVIAPFTRWSESTNNNIDPEVFYNATGCLRNLSCAEKKERDAMRKCPNLIDSLISYTQSCVADENPDDKSVENSTCILHNLTYQLETEAPDSFSNYYPKEAAQKKSPTTTGCFSPKSSKVEKEFLFDGKPDSAPSGVMCLSHPKTMGTYISLLGSSTKDGTLEACCGALQNLTASRGPGSAAMSQILVRKLQVLQCMAPIMKSPNQSLQKTAISLLSNLSRTSSLQPTIAKQVLPELTSNLINGPRKMGNSDETTATMCNLVQTLMLADSEVGKKSLSTELISAVADLSEDGSYSNGRKAAALLLYSLWNDKNLQGAAKKLGFTKALFVNENTSAVRKSMQVID